MTRTLRRTIGVVLLVVLGGGVRGLLEAQQVAPPVGTGFISGQVVEGGTTKPVPGATVFASNVDSRGPRAPNPEVIADAQGRFVFSGVPAGEFRLRASKPGWRAGAYGLDGPVQGLGTGGEILTLAAGERVRATVPVWRGALISGRVTDDAGEPLAGARVSASRWTSIRGHRSLVTSGGATTDDRGSFTLSIDPGEYMVSASSEQVRLVKARPHVFRQTLYPRSLSTSGASTIAVKSGEERNGLQIQLSLEPASRIAGVLNRLDPGRMPQRLELRSVDREMTLQYPTRAIDAQGRFAFENLPAGRYVLQTPGGGLGAQEPTENMELWARVAIDVAKSDLEISVDLRRPLVVSGRVHFDGTAATPTPQDGVTIGVRLFREEDLPLTDVAPRYTPVGVDGRFTVAVTPGRYVVASGASVRQDLRNGRGAGAASRAWSLRSSSLGGRDVADFPLLVTSDVSGLELTFTDRQPLLRGLVTSRQGRVGSAQLMVFPTDEALWKEFPVGRRFQSVRLPDAGTFELRNLPEGTYFVAAVRNLPQDYESWVTPDFLVALSRIARQVTLLEGQTTTQDVELSPSPAFNAALAPPAPVVEPTDRAIIREVSASTQTTGATISGIVLAAGSNTPIAAARVGLTPGLLGVPNIGGAYTDDQGRFVLADVLPGTHTLYVFKPQYVSTVFGATRPNDPGTPVTVTTGQQLSGLTIQMTKGAAIGGTVLDQNGQPLPNVQISLRAYQWTPRGREPVVARSPTVLGGAIANARGEYRAFGLPPGDYIIQATVQGFTSAMPLTTQADVDAATRRTAAGGAAATRPPVEVIYTPMFYPDTPDPSGAQVIRLEPGQDREIDFQFKLIPTATVTGTVRTSDGLPPARLSVILTQNDPLVGGATRTRTGSADSTGAFTIRGVPPGRYLLTVTTTLAASPQQLGALELFVDRDVSGIVLDAVPMATVTGTIRGELSAVRQPTVRLSLAPLPGTLVTINYSRSAVIGADNRFSIPNVPPGRYRFELTGPNNVVKPRVATQAVRGVDMTDSGLDIKGGETVDVDVELVGSEAQVGGRLRDRAGQPVTRPYVVLFAKEPPAWTPPSRRIFGLRPDQNGRYLFPDVPAGDYLITILTDVESGDWFNPALLAKIASIAAPVTVRRGDKLEIDLETR